MDMIRKTILSLALTGLALVGSYSQEKVISIYGNSYASSAQAIVQTRGSVMSDGIIKIGIVSDLEGDIADIDKSVQKLKNVSGLDGIIIAGDCYENEAIRRQPLFPNSTDNIKEMAAIEKYAALKVPVFVIPGNHETRDIYEKAILKMHDDGYVGIFDINGRSVDLKGLNIIGLGGYYDNKFMPENGFLLTREDYSRAVRQILSYKSQNEETLLVTHSPPYTQGGKIDRILQGANVGDVNISLMLSDPRLGKFDNVNGHIHEAGGTSAEFPDGNSYNVAAINPLNNPTSGDVTLLTIYGNGKKEFTQLK